jgi:thiamine pyrophosphate-dependent acetolactate synthase large subunit-like protein
MRVNEAIVRILAREGVENAFALMSEEIIPLLSTIEADWSEEINLIQARHEQAAAAMADGYARTTGDVGVCLVGRGPAIAQTGTSLLTARNAGSNVLYIVAETGLSATYDDKAFEQQSFLETMVGNVVSVRDPETLVPQFRNAFRELRSAPGSIAVQVPEDILEAELGADSLGYEPATLPTGQDARLHPDDDAIDRAADRYLDSDATKPPVLLAGQGAVRADAGAAIERLAERVNGFLATTLQAQGYFSDHPYSLGFVGSLGQPVANERLRESDFVVAFGCSLNPHTTDSGHLLRDDAKLVQVDTDPARFERYTGVDLGVLGDARATATALEAELSARGIDREGEFWTDANREAIASRSVMADREFPDRSGTMDPRDVVRRLDELLPADRFVVHDAGHFATWVRDAIDIPGPDDHIWTLDLAAVGLGLPIGIGAAVATEERTPVTFCGDAGIMMSLQELETAVRYDVPIVVVVMNDETLGAEYHVGTGDDYAPAAAEIESPDVGAVAEALGAEGYTVRSVAELDGLADRIGGRPDGPVVVDCRTNRNVRNRLYG